ncbi:MAG: hypothetical protein R6W76_21730 [Caldilinea sp.]
MSVSVGIACISLPAIHSTASAMRRTSAARESSASVRADSCQRSLTAACHGPLLNFAVFAWFQAVRWFAVDAAQPVMQIRCVVEDQQRLAVLKTGVVQSFGDGDGAMPGAGVGRAAADVDQLSVYAVFACFLLSQPSFIAFHCSW